MDSSGTFTVLYMTMTMILFALNTFTMNGNDKH